MIVLDTDHLSFLQRPSSPEGQVLLRRLEASADRDIVTTVISAEEQLRSWLGLIRRYQDVRRQSVYYGKLIEFLRFYGDWRILPFEQPAIDRFLQLRGARIRIGSLDLKIAGIVLSHGATLLTRNSAEFGRVPGLRFEDWTADDS